MTGLARFLYPDGIVKHGPWFSCSDSTATKIRAWALLQWSRAA